MMNGNGEFYAEIRRQWAAMRKEENAAALLARCCVGDEMAWRGSCPSGATFGGYFRYDGDAAAVMERVRKTSETLVKVSEVRGEIAVAQMRTA